MTSSTKGLFYSGAGRSFGIRFVGVLLIFFAHTLLVRALGDEGYGSFVYVVNLAALEVVVLTLGLGQAAQRFVPAALSFRDLREYKCFFRFSVGTALIVGGAAGLSQFALTMIADDVLPRRMLDAAQVAAILIPGFVLLSIAEGLMLGQKSLLWAQVTQNILLPVVLGLVSICMLASIYSGDYISMIGAQSLVFLLGACLLIYRARPKACFPNDLELPLERVRSKAIHDEGTSWRGQFGKYLKVSMPLAGVNFLMTFLRRGDILVLGLFVGPAVLAQYAVVQRIAGLALFGQAAGNSILRPMVSELYVQKKWEALQEVVDRALGVTLLTSLPVFVACFVGSGLVLGIFGESYESAWPLLMLYCLGPLINAMSGPVGPLLSLTGHQNFYFKVMFATTVFTLIALVLMVLAWGAMGAATAAVLSVLIRSAWLSWGVVKRMQIRPYLGVNVVKILWADVSMATKAMAARPRGGS